MEKRLRPIDSVKFLPGGKIRITMNIKIREQDLSELELPFDSSREAIAWVNGMIDKFNGLSTNKYRGAIELTKEETIKLVERCEDVKRQILAGS